MAQPWLPLPTTALADRLRRVIFGLEKDTQADTVIWKINFQLFERDNKTHDFGDAIVPLFMPTRKRPLRTV